MKLEATEFNFLWQKVHQREAHTHFHKNIKLNDEREAILFHITFYQVWNDINQISSASAFGRLALSNTFHNEMLQYVVSVPVLSFRECIVPYIPRKCPLLTKGAKMSKFAGHNTVLQMKVFHTFFLTWNLLISNDLFKVVKFKIA